VETRFTELKKLEEERAAVLRNQEEIARKLAEEEARQLV
jgi:hypothetical protein